MPKKKNPFKVKKSNKLKAKKISARSYADDNRGHIIASLVDRARSLQSEIRRVKPMYDELDKIVEELMKVRDELPSGVVLVDTFTDSNKRWKSVCMTRFELEFGDE